MRLARRSRMSLTMPESNTPLNKPDRKNQILSTIHSHVQQWTRHGLSTIEQYD